MTARITCKTENPCEAHQLVLLMRSLETTPLMRQMALILYAAQGYEAAAGFLRRNGRPRRVLLGKRP